MEVGQVDRRWDVRIHQQLPGRWSMQKYLSQTCCSLTSPIITVWKDAGRPDKVGLHTRVSGCRDETQTWRTLFPENEHFIALSSLRTFKGIPFLINNILSTLFEKQVQHPIEYLQRSRYLLRLFTLSNIFKTSLQNKHFHSGVQNIV